MPLSVLGDPHAVGLGAAGHNDVGGPVGGECCGGDGCSGFQGVGVGLCFGYWVGGGECEGAEEGDEGPVEEEGAGEGAGVAWWRYHLAWCVTAIELWAGKVR